jgi:hypothetical protein
VDKIISALLDRQRDLAVSALQHPKRDPFDHGNEAGMYAGLQAALDIIEEISAGKPPLKVVSRKETY